jgi:hypothetical protein
MNFKEKNQLIFMQLVMMFHTLTMQQLGKIKNPVTDTVERDLGAAQGSIDMLEMLKEKTKSNLAAEEDRFLTNLLKELRLNYVDEASKPVEPASKPEPPKTEEGTPPS